MCVSRSGLDCLTKSPILRTNQMLLEKVMSEKFEKRELIGLFVTLRSESVEPSRIIIW